MTVSEYWLQDLFTSLSPFSYPNLFISSGQLVTRRHIRVASNAFRYSTLLIVDEHIDLSLTPKFRQIRLHLVNIYSSSGGERRP